MGGEKVIKAKRKIMGNETEKGDAGENTRC